MTGLETASPQAWMDKAQRDLRSAHLLLSDRDADGAINRAFYAMFHAATAALAVRGEACSTHAGLISRFSALFVQTGAIPKEMGRAFNLAEKARLESDYRGAGGASIHAAETVLKDAEAFIAAVAERLIPAPGA